MMQTTSLGLKHNVNALVDYDAQWPAAFDAEKSRLQTALGATAVSIEHYGSTAVPGLRAKPILDIMVGVAKLDDWEKCRAPLEALGYDYAENAGVPGHYIFGRGRDKTERTHLVHIVEFEGASWRTALAFRDKLRSDSGLRDNYLQAKQSAVTAAPENRAAYNAAKGAFFEHVAGQLAGEPGEGSTEKLVLDTLGKIDDKIAQIVTKLETPSPPETGYFTTNKKIGFAVLAAIILGLYFLT